MIRLHHLNQSRSLRILWLLEELGAPYEVVPYQRDATTRLAPESLKAIHPLGKSPVIEMDGEVIAESEAITALLIERFAADRLRPAMDSADYGYYLQWMAFAESSLMVPLLLDIFTQAAGVGDNPFLSRYIGDEKRKLLTYLNEVLADKKYLVGNRLSGADFMLSFDLIMLAGKGELENYANLKQYIERLSQLESYQRAMEIEAKFNH